MAPQGDNYAIGMCVMILLSRVIPQIMASSRFGEPDRAVPFPAECHHLGFQLVEAATMQDSLLLI